jgi:hypothetical protein
MKTKKTTTILSIAIALNFVPVKKADACIFIISPMAATIGLGIAASTLTPYLFDFDGMINSSYDQYVDELFFGIFAISLLDQDLNRLESGLSSAFPSIPKYIINEAASMLKTKIQNVSFDQNGRKSVYLTLEEFAEIEKAIPLNVNETEVNAFKKILTTPELNQ